VFAAPHGGYIDLHNFRAREWRPALDATGVAYRRPYALRHTFATNALAAGPGLYELARYMRTTVELIDQTYGHLAPGAEEAARAKLDALANGLGV
jgi:integrase